MVPAEEGVIRLQIHGEYELRYDRMQSFPLDVSETVLLAHPGAVSDSLGQNSWVEHWFRVTPRAQLGKTLELVGQMDVLTGILGDTAHDTFADQTPRDQNNAFSNVQPRWLYLDWLTPVGLVRVGQMPNHWGMGLVANDGDHPSLFGDYRYGSIGDGLIFGTKPLGKDGPLTVALGGQYVFKDPLVDLSRGDRAVQGILAAFLEKDGDRIGVYGAYRHQWSGHTSDSPLYTYTDSIDAVVIDVAGNAITAVPGTDAWIFGSAEAALLVGSTDELRTPDQALTGEKTNLRSYGGAAQVGVVHVAKNGAPSHDDPADWGDLVGQIELGYASGDADPYGNTQTRFTFDPNHKVGLLLFDEVLRFQTARAASAAQDGNLSNAARPTPGVNLIPSQGGVFGAEYINPTAIVRPRPWFDLKAGMVIAQATSDVIDPYRTALHGQQNYGGGDPGRRDLGVEFDAGFEVRIPVQDTLRLALGAQGAVLAPGGALADANGDRMRAPWLLVGRAGIQF